MEGKESPRHMAEAIVRTLRSAGHEAYFVGGCVRDLVLGRQPGDYDIVTSAFPGDVQALFPVTYPVGASFGVVLVVVEGRPFEVATYRTEDAYLDGRRPSGVTFGSLEEDVRRRDFTVNGLVLDPETDRVIDLVGGLDDIQRRLLRTIGTAEDRFAEDRLRMLRAVRFAANLAFDLDGEALAAIRMQAKAIHRISAERIREELTKLLTRPGARRGLEWLEATGLLEELLPEVGALRGVEQPPAFHPEGDVWSHTLGMLELLHEGDRQEADPRLAWAALLHDVGKAVTRTEDSQGVRFYGHVEKGVAIAGAVLRRFKFSNADTETILSLIGQHMRFMHVRDMRPGTLKRFLRQPDFDLHLALHRLDCLGSHGLLENFTYCQEALAALPEEALRPPRLLTGHDLIALGLTPGPLFREILAAVEDAQLNGEIGDPEEARALVRARWG
jgi:poly(A) polymerase